MAPGIQDKGGHPERSWPRASKTFCTPLMLFSFILLKPLLIFLVWNLWIYDRHLPTMKWRYRYWYGY